MIIVISVFRQDYFIGDISIDSCVLFAPVLGLLATVVSHCKARLEQDVLEVDLIRSAWVDDDVSNDSEILAALYIA